jgi:cytoskeleton protein RodZ
VYSKIIFAGSRESIQAKPPLNITVGNAGATSMSMNGKPVQLGSHMRGNVARLTLNN